MLHIRFQYPTGATLGYSIEQLSTGLFYDFSTGTFVASPATLITALPEDTGSFQGRYIVNLATPTTVFTNDDYIVSAHIATGSNYTVVAELSCTIIGGSDSTVTAPVLANTGYWRAGG